MTTYRIGQKVEVVTSGTGAILTVLGQYDPGTRFWKCRWPDGAESVMRDDWIRPLPECRHENAPSPEPYDEDGRKLQYPVYVQCPDCGEKVEIRRSGGRSGEF